MFRIGHLTVDHPLVLAPMAGITDRHFRKIIRELGGVGIVSMEFLSSDALTRGNERTLNLMAFEQEERPLAIQIYGSTPERMARAAEIVQETGADVCDINMGCPANKILKGCAGAALMGDLGLARDIIRIVRRRISIPLTVKFRAGLDEARSNYLELGRICESEGVDAVALHARTARQMFSGRADWERIRRLKEAVRIPVSGNGDVEVPADALALWQATGCDGVMIGRAAIKNPWIFRQIAAARAGSLPREPSIEERRDLILYHFSLLREREEEHFALHKIRTFTGWYTHGLPNGRALRQQINSMVSVSQFIDAIEEFFQVLVAA